jgi:hypothetical protein
MTVNSRGDAVVITVNNPGSGEAGVAYQQCADNFGCYTESGFDEATCFGHTDNCTHNSNCCRLTSCATIPRNCDGSAGTTTSEGASTSTQECGTTLCTGDSSGPLIQNSEGITHNQCSADHGSVFYSGGASQFLADNQGNGHIYDMRTQAQKDAGCEPCALISDMVVTVTDSIGTSVATIVTTSSVAEF